jgi:inner membrane protein
MMLYTHLAISLLFIILFFPVMDFKVVFVVVAIIATFLPDLDNAYSSVGKSKFLRPMQFFVKHRGFLHSFTFLIIISAVFAWFVPVIAFPFFLGYSLHLLGDSFTKEGIAPFWPYSKRSAGRFRTGGVSEVPIFLFFIFLDLLAVILIIFR